jgi:hypothetical protein
MHHEYPRLFRRRRKDGSVGPVWYGWFYDATGKQVCRSTKRTDRRAAARVRAGWERDAAEPGHAAARDAVLLDAIELLLQARKEQVSAGRKSEATSGFYREKAGHWLRLLGEDFALAQLSATDVDRPPRMSEQQRVCAPAARGGPQRSTQASACPPITVPPIAPKDPAWWLGRIGSAGVFAAASADCRWRLYARPRLAVLSTKLMPQSAFARASLYRPMQ